MSRRFWKRLAGCIAINCALAAAPEYKGAAATAGRASAVVLEDRKGNRVVFAESDFPVTTAVSDFVAAQLARRYGLDRAALLLRGGMAQGMPPQPAAADDIMAAISAAMGLTEPVMVSYDRSTISIATLEGKCIAGIPRGPCAGGDPVRSPIRASFQMVEPEHGLQVRGEAPAAYPVQAIALGKEAAILGLSGAGQYPATKGLIAIPYANDVRTAPASARVSAAIRRVLARVGR